MSGLFKNFDRLVSASSLSQPGHKYIVRNFLSNFSPAINYYVPNEKLQRGHTRDVFELAIISYQLQRENVENKAMLSNLSENDHACLYKELQQKSQQNQEYISDALHEINLQLGVGITGTPVSALAQLTYILGQQKPTNAVQTFNEYVKPQLLEKIGYTSQQDLVDLVEGLRNIGIVEKSVWTPILNRIENKTFDWQLKNVQLHAWETSLYELPEKTCGNFYSRLTHTQRHYQDVVNGNTGMVSEVKRGVYKAFDELFFRAINPLFFRDQRQAQFFYPLEEEDHRDSLIENLKAVAEKVPEASKTAQVLSNRG